MNGLIYSDSKGKANILNDKFCSVFTRENTNDLPAPDVSPHPSMLEIQVNNAGVFKLLKKLNPRKAADPDGIPCRLTTDGSGGGSISPHPAF